MNQSFCAGLLYFKILYSGILALQNQESTDSNLMGVGQQNGKSEYEDGGFGK